MSKKSIVCPECKQTLTTKKPGWVPSHPDNDGSTCLGSGQEGLPPNEAAEAVDIEEN